MMRTDPNPSPLSKVSPAFSEGRIIEALAAALKRYGRHLDSCPCCAAGGPGVRCTCGFGGIKG